MRDKGRNITLALWNVVLPLVAGMVIYVIWNPNTYIGAFAGRLPVLRGLRYPENRWNSQISIWIKYYGADMAWAYGFGFSLCLTAGFERRSLAICFAAGILMEILLEMAQRMHIISGYFDIWDIVVEIAMNICAYFVWNYVQEKYQKQ